MKKMLLSYSFLLCFLHIAVCSLAANPVQKAFSSRWISEARNSSVVKKSDPFPADTGSDHVANNLLSQVNSRFVSGASHPQAAEARSFQLIFGLTTKEAVQNGEVERVLKDYLLHIFPSHYFW